MSRVVAGRRRGAGDAVSGFRVERMCGRPKSRGVDRRRYFVAFPLSSTFPSRRPANLGTPRHQREDRDRDDEKQKQPQALFTDPVGTGQRVEPEPRERQQQRRDDRSYGPARTSRIRRTLERPHWRIRRRERARGAALIGKRGSGIRLSLSAYRLAASINQANEYY